MICDDSNFLSDFDKLVHEAKIMQEGYAIAQAIFDSARKELQNASRCVHVKKAEIRTLIEARADMKVFI